MRSLTPINQTTDVKIEPKQLKIYLGFKKNTYPILTNNKANRQFLFQLKYEIHFFFNFRFSILIHLGIIFLSFISMHVRLDYPTDSSEQIGLNVQNLRIYNHFHMYFSIHVDPLKSLYF